MKRIVKILASSAIAVSVLSPAAGAHASGYSHIVFTSMTHTFGRRYSCLYTYHFVEPDSTVTADQHVSVLRGALRFVADPVNAQHSFAIGCG